MKKTRFTNKKYKTSIVSYALYQKWVKKYPEYSHIKFQGFKDLLKDLLNKYKEEILTNTHGVRLPFYLGDISIKYVDMENINPSASLEVGKEVKYLNFQSFRKAAKILWVIKHARKFNRFLKYMAFKPHTSIRKEAKSKIIENPGMFKNSELK